MVQKPSEGLASEVNSTQVTKKTVESVDTV